MAYKKPLVLYGGHIGQLQADDVLDIGITGSNSFVKVNEDTVDLTIGMPVYLSSAGKVKRAVATNTDAAEVIGLVKSATIEQNESGLIQTSGIISSPDWSEIVGEETLTEGAEYFLSTNAGELTTTPPSETGQFLVFVGRAISGTDLHLSIERKIIL